MKTVTDNYVEALAEVKTLLTDVVADPMTTPQGDTLLALVRETEAVGRQVDTLRATLAAQVNHLSAKGTEPNLAEQHGFTRGKYFLEHLTGASGADIGRRIRLGEAIRPRITLTGEVLPAEHEPVAAAVRAGDIGVEAAAVIIHCIDDAGRCATPTAVWEAETILVGNAGDTPVDLLKDQARLFREALDPDGVEPREDAIRHRRAITLGRERNGVTPISGQLAPELAALLKSTFDEVNAPGAAPRFVDGNPWATTAAKDPTAETAEESGEVSVSIVDHRTREQQQHDALYGMLKAGIRSVGTGPGEMASRAEVTAVIREDDLLTGHGVGWVAGIGEPVSATTLRMWLCDAGYRKALLGADGEVLALGKTQYPFSAGQRKAIAVRDGGCISCGDPAAWCDVHHVQPYNADGGKGKTDVDNGVLLCRRCHTFIHTSAYQLRMTAGVPYLLAPHSIDPTQTWKRLRTHRINQKIPRPARSEF